MNKNILWVGVIILIGLIIAFLLFLRKPTYEVKFVSGGDAVLDVVKVKENDMVEKPTDPLKEGYVFDGWYLNGEKFDFSTKIIKDIVLEAKWIKESSFIYTITFDSNGGSEVESIQIESNGTIDNLPIPKKDGYKFIGWYVGDKKVDSNTKITESLTLIAKWEKDLISKTKVKVTTKKTAIPAKTTKVTTTVVNKDVISYEMIDLKDDTTGKVTLYILKNGEKVAGSCNITTNSGATVKKDVPVTGYITNKKIINKITNVKVD